MFVAQIDQHRGKQQIFALLGNVGYLIYITAAWLVLLVERQSAVREVEGSSPRADQRSGPELRRMCCLCNYICKWLDVQIFSDKDYKPYASPPASSALITWLAGRDVKEPTRLSKRVGHVVPGVVVWPCLSGWCFT